MIYHLVTRMEMKIVFLAFLIATCLVIAQENRPPTPIIISSIIHGQVLNSVTVNSVFSSNLFFAVGSPQSQPFKRVSNMRSMMIYLQQEGASFPSGNTYLPVCLPQLAELNTSFDCLISI